MPKSRKVPFIPVEKYLRLEEESGIKHEYVDGQMFAMTGGTRNHSVIASNIIAILRAHVRGSGCRVHGGEYKVFVRSSNCMYYPDVFVECGQTEGGALFSEEAVLIVEVLSRSTARTDRREKVQAYKQIPSLKEYLIVYQSRQRAELHRRGPDGRFEATEFEPGSDLVLESVGANPLRLPLESIYEDTDIRPKTELELKEEDTKYGIFAEEPVDW